MKIIMIDISSSMIDYLSGVCRDFYEKTLNLLANRDVYVYFFPALKTSNCVEFILLRSENLSELVNNICNSQHRRGTPLIKAIDRVLNLESNISELVIISDLLSDDSDSADPIDSIAEKLNTRNLELKVVWLESRERSGQTREYFVSLVKKLLTMRRPGLDENVLERFDVLSLLIRAQSINVLRFARVNIYGIRESVDYYIGVLGQTLEPI